MDDEQPSRRRRRPVTPPEPSARTVELLKETAEVFGELRRLYHRAVSAVHELEVRDVAGELGYAYTSRLLADHVRLDPGEVTALRRCAELTRPRVQPSGHAAPPVLPVTAQMLSEGVVGDGHVRVIADAMARLSGVPHLDPTTLADTEARLAGWARDRTPAALAAAAADACDELDPDGAAPADDREPVDELRLLSRADGSLRGRFRFVDPVAAEVIRTALRAATPAPTADGDPTATDGPADLRPSPAGDAGGRSREQRQAQGLRDLCAQSLTRGLDQVDAPDEPTSLDEPTFAEEPISPHEPAFAEEHDGDDTGDDDGPGETQTPHEPVEIDGPVECHDLDLANLDLSDLDEPADLDELSAVLSDPAALDSVVERAIAALLDRPAPRGADHRRPRTGTDTGTGTTETPGTTKAPETPSSRAPADGVEGGERIHLAVTVDYETLRARLADTDTSAGLAPPRGQPRLPGLGRLGDETKIGPETARRLACDADILPIVLGARSEPLDIGRKTRVVPLPMRRAVVARDRHCAFPGCRRRPRACQAHHVVHWIFGGPTVIDNLTLLCSYHHTLVHHGGWAVHMIDGQPWFTPPYWLDRRRRPRNNRPWCSEPTPACLV